MDKPNLSDARILIAEDQPINQFILKKLFAQWSITPVIVSDGEEAIASIKKQPFDLVFLDIHMPIMGGYEAAEIIHELHPELPIVAISAAINPYSSDEAAKVGMKSFIAKPYKPEELLEEIKAVIKS